MLNWKNSYLICFLCIYMSGCDLVKMKEDILGDDLNEEVKPLARVSDIYLYPTDLEGVVNEGVSYEDSAARVSNYIDSWVRKQLLITEATAQLEFDEATVERKVLDYRYSLITYEYKSNYINKTLDKAVNDIEIESYYNNNTDNFPLRQNIVRGRYIKLPNDAPKIDRIKKLMSSKKEEDIEEVRTYCFSYASVYSLEDSLWLNFDEIIQSTPLAEITNKVEFLKKRKFVDTSDENSIYLLKINEYKITDDIAPLEVVKEQIVDIIINKRKVALAANLEKEVYEKATKNGLYEVYH